MTNRYLSLLQLRKETRAFVMALKRTSMQLGHRAVTDIMGGEEIEDPALLKLRDEAERLFHHLGYWRANFHVWEQGTDSFYPWHLSPHGFVEGRIKLPFIDLYNGRFRDLSERFKIEQSGRWYDKSAARQASKSTSRRSLIWLQWWLDNYEEPDTEPLVVIHEGEILLWLLALNPELLPVAGRQHSTSLSSDGQYAYQQYPLAPHNIASKISRWLKSPKLYQPTSYRDFLVSNLGDEMRLRLLDLLSSIRRRPDVTDIDRLHQEEPFAALREMAESNEKLVRVRMEEALISGTRSMVIWPVSSYVPPNVVNSRGEQNLFFCLIALQPQFGLPDPAKLTLLRYVIESSLLLTVPAQMVVEGQKIGGAIAVEAMADTLAHEVKSLAHSVKMHIDLHPEGPHRSLVAECDIVLCISTEFQNIFKRRIRPIKQADLRDKIKKRIGWDELRKDGAQSIPELKLSFPTPDAHVLDALLPILLELLRNARKYTRVTRQVVSVNVTEKEDNGQMGTWFSVSNFGTIPQNALDRLTKPRSFLPHGEHGADLLKWTVEVWLQGRISWRNEETPDGPMTFVEGWIPNSLIKIGAIAR